MPSRVNRQAWTDALVFIAMGILCIVESWHLNVTSDPNMLHQELRPGLYVLLLGIVLVGAGVVHIATHRNIAVMVHEALDRAARMRLGGVFGTLIAYALLIPIVGYIAATAGLFFVLFRIFGVKSWIANAALSAASAAVFYMLFVKFCDVIFPRGALFG